jgi:hypothetical protein
MCLGVQGQRQVDVSVGDHAAHLRAAEAESEHEQPFDAAGAGSSKLITTVRGAGSPGE